MSASTRNLPRGAEKFFSKNEFLEVAIWICKTMFSLEPAEFSPFGEGAEARKKFYVFEYTILFRLTSCQPVGRPPLSNGRGGLFLKRLSFGEIFGEEMARA